MRIFCLFVILFVSSSVHVNSQELKIRSVALQPSDKTAVVRLCLDNNGDTCALLKIKTDNLEGIEFSNPNQFIKATYADGIYSVYLPESSRKLDLKHKDYMPIQLDMADYGYKRLRKGKTYLVVLDAPKKVDLKSSVIFKIEPQNAIVTFDKKQLRSSKNGTYEIPVTAGIYSYTVKADDYQLKEGSVSIGKSEVKTFSIRLIPITHEVNVSSNVNKARVFVDNVDYGQVGKMFIPQGKHNIRIQAEGYVDSEKDVYVNASTGSLLFVLKENKRTTHIHATPVIIYAPNSPCVYKNGKKIKEWTNGATIMFMPGKYLLSTFERGNEKEIIVGSEPMTVNL